MTLENILASRIFIILFTYGIHLGLYASEVDSFTYRFTQIKDSLAVIDSETNRRFELAIYEANEETGCSRKRLYKKINTHLARKLIGQMEMFMNKDPRVDIRKIKKKNSIYQFFKNPISTPTIAIHNKIGGLVKISGVFMGNDKLGHALSEGWTYFKKFYLENGDIEDALGYGDKTERFYYGLRTTGVYSWADLTANFQGMRMWNTFVSDYPDILTRKKESPYFICEKDKWQVNRTFSWSHWIDMAWDEAINCSSFANKKLKESIDTVIETLQAKNNQNLSCPIDFYSLIKLKSKYKEFSSLLLNLDLVRVKKSF